MNAGSFFRLFQVRQMVVVQLQHSPRRSKDTVQLMLSAICQPLSLACSGEIHNDAISQRHYKQYDEGTVSLD